MAEPFLGEVRLFGFGFAPQGWAFCNGQLLAINQNQALFSLLGTMYGGNGTTNFSLPNLQGRAPMHAGNGHAIGELGGETAHTLTIAETPAHTHPPVQASTANANADPAAGNVLGSVANLYGGTTSLLALHPATVTSVGGSQPHSNQQPYLVVNMCIALTGIFPSRN